MEDIVKVWSKVKELIKPDILEVSFNTWIEPTIPISMTLDEIVLQVPYPYSKTMIEERYMDLIKNALLFITKNEYQVEIKLQENPNERLSTPGMKINNLNPLYTYNNFIKGDSNILACSATLAVANSCIEGTYCEYNPLFIFGNPGLGKTHLMQAAGHYVLENNPDKKILYVTSEQFTNELINSIKDNKNQEFRDKYRSVDLLMIDDIQFISNMPSTQKEFHHTFNDLYQNNKMIIISGDRPPKELHGIEERLITRFESGNMHKIASPDYETRIAILYKKAEQLNIDIPDNVIRYIAERITTNNRELEGAMKMIVSYHRLMKREINIETVTEALADFEKTTEKKITPELVIKNVEKYFNLSDDSLKTNSRAKKISQPRQIAMYIMTNVLDMKLKDVGDIFGGKDHTTVIHACKTVEQKINSDEDSKNMIDEIIKNIKN